MPRSDLSRRFCSALRRHSFLVEIPWWMG